MKEFQACSLVRHDWHEHSDIAPRSTQHWARQLLGYWQRGFCWRFRYSGNRAAASAERQRGLG